MSDGIPCTWMRGGTSKGAYFLASDLPADAGERDRLLLSIMEEQFKYINLFGALLGFVIGLVNLLVLRLL